MKTLTLALTALSFALFAALVCAEDPAAAKREQPLPETAQKIKQLRQERLAALQAASDLAGRLAEQGRATIEEACEARVAALQAELELAERPADQVALCQSTVDTLEQYEELAKARKAAARGTELSVVRAKVWKLEMLIRLEEAKAKLAESK